MPCSSAEREDWAFCMLVGLDVLRADGFELVFALALVDVDLALLPARDDVDLALVLAREDVDRALVPARDDVDLAVDLGFCLVPFSSSWIESIVWSTIFLLSL